MPELLKRIAGAELDQLLADTSTVAHRALWALLWEGYMRSTECLSLSVRDIDLAQGTTRVDYLTRGSGPVTVALAEKALPLLRDTIGDQRDGPALHVEGRPSRHSPHGASGRVQHPGLPNGRQADATGGPAPTDRATAVVRPDL
ncbi:tyrosine-type recombinase/integrase [Streptomyces sp. NPDC007083]|uniref:tyrosine-type recombinase/integrase n=1 Tax=Streptomyces sp. NPDC007083 TaxID=3156913 RepID=UPI0033E031FE